MGKWEVTTQKTRAEILKQASPEFKREKRLEKILQARSMQKTFADKSKPKETTMAAPPIVRLDPVYTGIIPVLGIVYLSIDFTERFLMRLSEEPRVSVTIVENKSKNSDQLKELIQLWMNKGLVTRHIVMDENITNNAVELVLRNKEFDLKDSPFGIITDGDAIPSAGFKEEQIRLLEKYQHMESVSLACSGHLLPGSAKNRGEYFESGNPVVMTMMRSQAINDFINWIWERGIHFYDVNLYRFAKSRGNFSAVLKDHFSQNMSRTEMVTNPTSEYVQDVKSKRRGGNLMDSTMWMHGNWCGYSVTDFSGESKRVEVSVERPKPTAEWLFLEEHFWKYGPDVSLNKIAEITGFSVNEVKHFKKNGHKIWP